VLGIPTPPEVLLDVGATIDQLAYDATSPSTIGGAILAAKAGARATSSPARCGSA
jgi:hypothetical protein